MREGVIAGERGERGQAARLELVQSRRLVGGSDAQFTEGSTTDPDGVRRPS